MNAKKAWVYLVSRKEEMEISDGEIGGDSGSQISLSSGKNLVDHRRSFTGLRIWRRNVCSPLLSLNICTYIQPLRLHTRYLVIATNIIPLALMLNYWNKKFKIIDNKLSFVRNHFGIINNYLKYAIGVYVTSNSLTITRIRQELFFSIICKQQVGNSATVLSLGHNQISLDQRSPTLRTSPTTKVSILNTTNHEYDFLDI